MRIVRKTYDWVLHWADTPYGIPALFLLAFAESSFFPIPPDVLLIALALGSPKRAFRFALWCSIASVIGGVFGYGIGYFLWWQSPGVYSGVADFFFAHIPGFTTHLFEVVQERYNEWGFWIVFTAGFTPIPYKIFTVSSGAFDMNFPMFLLASTISRSARFFIVSGLIYFFGPPIKSFIDAHFNKLSILFVVFLIAGFLVIKYLF